MDGLVRGAFQRSEKAIDVLLKSSVRTPISWQSGASCGSRCALAGDMRVAPQDSDGSRHDLVPIYRPTGLRFVTIG